MNDPLDRLVTLIFAAFMLVATVGLASGVAFLWMGRLP